MLSDEPIVVEDMRKEKRFKVPQLLRDHSVISRMSVMIQGQPHPFGVLGAHATKKRDFTDNDIHFLQAVAYVLAAAIERKHNEEERAQLLVSEKEARQEAELANRAKDEFLAMISHELRTPMTGILGWAELLRTDKLDEITSASALEAIERNANLQVQLIEDRLDISRIITGKLRLEMMPLEMKPIIEATVSALLPAAEAKQVKIIRCYEARNENIAGDPERLQQIISNLLSNAIKF